MSFTIRLTQTGEKKELAEAQARHFWEGLVRGCGNAITGQRLLGFRGSNIVQFAAKTRDIEDGVFRRDFWQNYAKQVQDQVDFSIRLNLLVPGDEMWFYHDCEPAIGDYDGDGERDDQFMKMDWVADTDIVAFLGTAYAIIRAEIIRRGMRPRAAGWSYGKAPWGNPSESQRDGVRFLHNVNKLDWYSYNGYPHEEQGKDPRWAPDYLGAAYASAVPLWKSTLGVPVIVAFQPRAKHTVAITGEEVYLAARAAAMHSDGWHVWLQAEQWAKDSTFKPLEEIDHFDYWAALLQPTFEPMAHGLIDGLAARA